MAKMNENEFIDTMNKAEDELVFLNDLSRECAKQVGGVVYSFLFDSLHDAYLKRLGYNPSGIDQEFWVRVQDLQHSILTANVSAISLIKDYLPAPGKKIIDIGCNDGGLVKELRRLEYDCYGVDLPVTITQARVKYPDIADRLFVCNLECDELPDGPYSLALALAVIEHLKNYTSFLIKVSKVLDPGGILYISTANREYREISLYHAHHFTENELAEMAAHAGLISLGYSQVGSRTNLTAVFKKVGQ